MKKRIIYTSPIKALSNQKYKDFKEKYPDDELMPSVEYELNGLIDIESKIDDLINMDFVYLYEKDASRENILKLLDNRI